VSLCVFSCLHHQRTSITDSNLETQPLDAVSKKNIIQIFNENKEAILVITGFIGSNDKHETTG
jgi:aspartokinase